MNEKQQILYMKIRLIRIASQKWNKSIGYVANQFMQCGVLQYIEENFDLFHMQGDESIFADICTFLNRQKTVGENNAN